MSVAEVETVKQNMYEGMFLLNSTKFAGDPEGSTETLMAILEKAGASVAVSYTHLTLPTIDSV